MKYRKLTFTVMLIVVFSGCSDSPSSTNEPKPGTIQIAVTNAPLFNNHTVWFSIWDSCDAITGGPTGEVRGFGFFEVQEGEGSSRCLSFNAQTIKSFTPGKYFTFYFADMNDNFSTINAVDSGDYVGGGSNYPIIVDGDVVKRLSGVDFSGPYPVY